MGEVLILVPAAGASSRMRGRDKLLEPVEGEALLRRQVRAASATGAPVLVTLPKGAGGPRAEVLEGISRLRFLWIDAAEGMAASLRAGAAAARKARAEGLMVHLPDMPDLTGADLARLLAAFAVAPETPLRAGSEDGRPGHPVVFPARLFSRLAEVSGDTGGRAALSGESPRLVALPGDRALTDLDTPDAWADWRARIGR
ncbi:CTP:molybdopterin cytidylyltransferase MocA [Rhodovulum sp. ES.010]|uniref:nucleotidyltransferase family protein n=1 Tax=Rhodovulum sp. ES.010 TaxID=1882821 RepID=UPI0009282E62|nr:NTP transferase domain-containing protein [Rhodovulum sp. ES.010]SIO19365.1 CTP:molybdopterin cytidylyltransferase MocA [Rhodovulum sp. ES.010]